MIEQSHKDLDSAIGAAIRVARQRQGLTQGELATLLGVDRSTIVKYERGQRTASVEALLQVAHALDLSLIALIPGATPANRSADVQRVMQLLERRPDLAQAVLAALDQALDREQQRATATNGAAEV